MRTPLAFTFAFAVTSVFAVTIPLRNPFWPIGYNGTREIISEEPRVQLKAASEPADDSETSVTAETIAEAEEAENAHTADRLWIAARKTLRIGGTMRLDNGKQAITINDKIYGDGDLVSVNVKDHRFTWRVKGLNGKDTLKLQRIRFRELDAETDEKGTQP